MFNKVIVSLLFTVFSLSSFALEPVPNQKISSIEIEVSKAFIGFDADFPAGSTCSGKRIWVGLDDEVGRVIYSTALMAFAADKTVMMQAHPSSAGTAVLGACKLYDIYVAK